MVGSVLEKLVDGLADADRAGEIGPFEAVGIGRVKAGHAFDRGFEVVEAAFGDQRRHFRAEAAGAGRLVDDQALAGLLENENMFFTVLNRFVIMPLFLFSGTFYPLTNMPIYLQWIGWISPLWHATELGRWLTYGHEISTLMLYTHFIFLNSLLLIGIVASRRIFTRRLGK